MVLIPRFDEDSIVRLSLEVLGNVIDDNHLFDITADPAQVLDKMPVMGNCMLSVKPEADVVGFIDEVQDPVCVLKR